VPPDVGVLRPPTSTVDTLLKDAEEFLCQVDPGLRDLVGKHSCKIFSPEGLREVVDPFTALSSGIIGQQVCECENSVLKSDKHIPESFYTLSYCLSIQPFFYE
jgi:hypothetical protein